MRMLLSNTWPISAKKIVSPFQSPMKNPGASEASDIGWWAHDASSKMDANSAAVQICLVGFIVFLAIDILWRPAGRVFFVLLFPRTSSWAIICRPSGTFFWFNTI